MSPEETKQEIEQLKAMLRRLSDEGNTVWEQLNDLRNEYRKLTGKDI